MRDKELRWQQLHRWGPGVVLSGKELRAHFIHSENPVTLCTEGAAISHTMLAGTVIYFKIFTVGENQIDPPSLLAVWKYLQQPDLVQRTGYENSKLRLEILI